MFQNMIIPTGGSGGEEDSFVEKLHLASSAATGGITQGLLSDTYIPNANEEALFIFNTGTSGRGNLIEDGTVVAYDAPSTNYKILYIKYSLKAGRSYQIGLYNPTPSALHDAYLFVIE